MDRLWTLETCLVAALLVAGAAARAGNGKGGGKGGGGSPPANPEIVYADGDTLYVMDADGGNRTQVFGASGFTPQPEWSADGTQIVFNSTHAGAGIYVVNVDGSGEHQVATLASQYVSGPSWSPTTAPDGHEWILFEDDGVGGDRDVFAVRPDTGERINLTETAGKGEGDVAWAPDASRFTAAVGQVENGAWDDDLWVFTLGVVDGRLAVVASENLSDAPGSPLAATGAFVTPNWSRDGTRIAVAADDGAWVGDLWIIPLANPASPVNITNTSSVTANFPSWAPDDSALVFERSGTRARDSGIFRINPDGSGETRLSRGRCPDWKR